jgi:glycosyltransferase involved in cell wall biosynthesis
MIPRVLESIAAQTCLPGKVILAVSGISEQQSADLLAGLPDYKKRFPVQVLAKAERMNAGPNRNRCALAADTEVVSFFDVDDIMHPRRLELVSFAFGAYHPKAVVHAYEESPKTKCDERAPSFGSGDLGKSFQIFDGIGIYDKSMTQDAERYNFLRTPISRGLDETTNHAGHISVLRSVFSEVQQTDMARGQDSRFARDILKHFGRHDDTMECLNVPLSLYCHQWQNKTKKVVKHIDGDGFLSVSDTKMRLHQALDPNSSSSERLSSPRTDVQTTNDRISRHSLTGTPNDTAASSSTTNFSSQTEHAQAYSLDLKMMMGAYEIQLFDQMLSKGSVYFEFGLGGSTLFASQHSNLNHITAVDSSEEWIHKVKSDQH